MAESWSVDEVQTFLSLVAEERMGKHGMKNLHLI